MIGWLALLLLAPLASAAAPPPELASVWVDEHFGRSLPLDARLTDEHGHEVRLGSFVRGDQPLLLLLAYYHCPMLCPVELHGASQAMRTARSRLGRDFRAVTVSFDPADGPADARRMQANVCTPRARGGAGAWPFLTGSEEAIDRITEAVGFAYHRVESSGQFAHGAVAVAVTPDGRVSSYLYGVPFTADELDRAMASAADGETGGRWSTVLLQHCFCWTPALRRYAGVLAGLLRSGGVVILLGAAAVIAIGVRRTRARSREVG